MHVKAPAPGGPRTKSSPRRARATALALALALALAGAQVACAEPVDEPLRLNHLQAKATHNSFHVEPPLNNLHDWDYTHAPLAVQLDQQGVRSLELDVHWSDGGELRVYHVAGLDDLSTCDRLRDCLAVLLAWSDAHPAHAPLHVQIEPKEDLDDREPEEVFTRIEQTILDVWPRPRILTPASIQREEASVAAGLARHGWPLLRESRQKILFVLDQEGTLRARYTHGRKDLDGRLLFATGSPGDPWAAVAVLNDPIDDAAQIRAALDAGFLVRTIADPSEAELERGDATRPSAALASGAHFLSTNYPAPGDHAYSFALPGGAPSRCNPVTAPAACTPAAIEAASR